MTVEEQKRFLDESGFKSRKAQLSSSMTMKDYLIMIEKRLKEQAADSELKWVEQFIKEIDKQAASDFDKNKVQALNNKLNELVA